MSRHSRCSSLNPTRSSLSWCRAGSLRTPSWPWTLRPTRRLLAIARSDGLPRQRQAVIPAGTVISMTWSLADTFIACRKPCARAKLILARIRRIKCDERKPQCQRCELGRRTCIGVFYGKPSGNISDSSASSPPSITSASRSASPPPRVAAMIVRRHGVPKSPNNPPQFVGTLDVRDLIHLAPSLATATHTVEPSADWYEFIRARVRELTSYIFYLPSRSGHDNALDSAIRCTASGFREFAQSGSDSLSLFRTGEKSVALYTSALRELQTALQDPKRSTSAEVLCATELLCIFEVWLFAKHYRVHCLTFYTLGLE